MGILCSMCKQEKSEVYTLYRRIKENIPRNRWYIFEEYRATSTSICIECYIKTRLMFQSLSGKPE